MQYLHTIHLLRGLGAALLLAAALLPELLHPFLRLGAGIGAFLLMRGCPMCWLMGLVEHWSQRKHRSALRAEESIT